MFSLNGNRGRSNNYLIDGTDMNDGYRNLPTINQAGVWGAPGTILPVDALAEIPVTGNPEAEFGRSAGATVNIVTKSGTNEIHGSAFEMFRNDALTARNYFNHLSPDGTVQPKNSFTDHQFGAMVSGPIVRDSTFFLLAYEGQRENGGLPQLGTVPTSNDIATLGGATNSVISNLLYTYKAWGALPKQRQHDLLHALSQCKRQRHRKGRSAPEMVQPPKISFGPLLLRPWHAELPLGMLFTGASVPGYNTLTPTHINIVSLSYTSVPRPNLIVEVRGGYNRFVQQFLPQDAGFDPTSIGLNTLPPGATATSDVRDSGLPTIAVNTCNATASGGAGVSPSVTPCSTIGATGSDSRGRVDSNYQLSVTSPTRMARTASRPASNGAAPPSTASSIPATAASWSSIRSPISFPERWNRQIALRLWRGHCLLLPEWKRRLLHGRLAHEPQDHRQLRPALGSRRRRRQERRLQPLRLQDSHGESAGRPGNAFFSLSQGLDKLRAPLQHGRRSDGQRQAGGAHWRGHFLRQRLTGLLRRQPGL